MGYHPGSKVRRNCVIIVCVLSVYTKRITTRFRMNNFKAFILSDIENTIDIYILHV